MGTAQMKLPLLPPGFIWDPRNGKPTSQIQWRALGPVVGGNRLPIEAHGILKEEDTPQHAADRAWRIWEHLSGISEREQLKNEMTTQWVRSFTQKIGKIIEEKPAEYLTFCDDFGEDLANIAKELRKL